MRSSHVLLSLFLSLSLLLQCISASNVITLTDANFDQIMEGRKLTATGDWFIEIYHEDCERCKLLAPEFEAFAQKAKGHLSVAKIDGATSPFLRRRFSTRSYPHFVLLRKGHYFPYQGEHNAEDFMKFATLGHRTAGNAIKLPPPPTTLELLMRDYDALVRDFDSLIASHRAVLTVVFVAGSFLGLMLGLIFGVCCCRPSIAVRQPVRQPEERQGPGVEQGQKDEKANKNSSKNKKE